MTRCPMWFPWLCLTIGISTATMAQAQTSAESTRPKVKLEMNPCGAASMAEIGRILRVELGALVTESPNDKDVTHVSISCDGPQIWVRIRDPITGKALSRIVSVKEEERLARSRLVALAVAELVAASWTELEANPEPQVPPAGPRASPQAVEAARELMKTRWQRLQKGYHEEIRIEALISRRAFFSGTGALWGGGVRVGRDQFEAVGWSADVFYEHGESAATLGTVSMDTFTVGGALYLYRRWSILAFQVGLALRAGAVRLSGDPNQSRTASADSGVAPWGWPAAVAGLRLHPVGPLVIELTGETGYVVLPIEGTSGGTREITVEGPWIASQLGVGFTL